MEQDQFKRGSELVHYTTDIFEAFKNGRAPWETVWEECWYNFLGQYQQNLNWRAKTEGKSGRSKHFVKITALKCHTAHSKLTDVLFPSNTGFPFDLVPEHLDEIGIDMETAKDLAHQTKNALQEQFTDMGLDDVFDSAILDLAIFGTGVIKGPIITTRIRRGVRPRMIAGMRVADIDKTISPYEVYQYPELAITFDHIPIWEYYVDPNAKSQEDSIGEIHFVRMLPADFALFSKQSGFDKAAVKDAIQKADQYNPDDKKYIMLGDNYTGTEGDKDKRVPVLEFWGLVPVSMLASAGVEIPSNIDADDIVEAVVVLAADNILLKAELSPFEKRPFHICQYKRRPNIIFGQGVAELMRDSQRMINSIIRLIIDNKAITGNGVFGANADRINMKKTGSMDLYPGKVFWTKGNFSPEEALKLFKFEDVFNGLDKLLELCFRLADEETALPKYTSGEQDSFLNKTATGISMLMTQANINLKPVLKNIDRLWIEPIVESAYAALVAINKMQVPLPFKIQATGFDSLIAKEIKLENMLRFMQITGSGQDAIFTDRMKIIKNAAHYLDQEDVMRNDEEIKALMQVLTEQAKAPDDLRARVDVDRLYPYLTKSERAQVLEQVGIKPDPGAPESVADLATPTKNKEKKKSESNS